jgi:hypothetical protein
MDSHDTPLTTTVSQHSSSRRASHGDERHVEAMTSPADSEDIRVSKSQSSRGQMIASVGDTESEERIGDFKKAGSGTTGVARKELKRRFLGCGIEKQAVGTGPSRIGTVG